jgi:hypothetical protein
MKVTIDYDERYPDYDVYDGGEIDIPDDVIRRWREVQKAYSEIQTEMKDYYSKHKNQ